MASSREKEVNRTLQASFGDVFASDAFYAKPDIRAVSVRESFTCFVESIISKAEGIMTPISDKVAKRYVSEKPFKKSM